MVPFGGASIGGAAMRAARRDSAAVRRIEDLGAWSEETLAAMFELTSDLIEEVGFVTML